uniref:Ovule protein n=1 Tax=Mesocestoides corti TaxID=53468 RepID=A0A5K3ESJ3_MESCO
MKKNGTTDKALLTNYKPDLNLRCHSFESTTLTSPFNKCHFSKVSVFGWLHILLACYWNGMRQRIG